MDIKDLYELFLRHPEVTTDTRHCPADSLFFALRGATFDGNAFAAAALEAGCAYAVVDDPSVPVGGDGRYILVDEGYQPDRSCPEGGRIGRRRGETRRGILCQRLRSTPRTAFRNA